MNICLVSQDYPPETARGGISTQVLNKASALARLGHGVHVLSCAAGPGPDLLTASEGGVSVHRMQAPGASASIEIPIYSPSAYWLGYTWNVFRHLRRLSTATTFDVI